MNNLDTTHRVQSQGNTKEYLETSHQGLCSPGCRNLNRQEGAKFQESAVGSRDLNDDLDTTHRGTTAENLGTAHQGEDVNNDLGTTHNTSPAPHRMRKVLPRLRGSLWKEPVRATITHRRREQTTYASTDLTSHLRPRKQ